MVSMTFYKSACSAFESVSFLTPHREIHTRKQSFTMIFFRADKLRSMRCSFVPESKKKKNAQRIMKSENIRIDL